MGRQLQERRSRLVAVLWYACALHSNAWGWPVPPDVLEALEIEARLARAEQDELRRRPTR